jgi:hypothetical protein
MQIWILEADLMGRTVAFKNMEGELIAIAAKSTKAMILSQVVGSGSEMIVDVAPGVDWTAVLGVMMCMQQARRLYLDKCLCVMWGSDLHLGIRTAHTVASMHESGRCKAIGLSVHTLGCWRRRCCA